MKSLVTYFSATGITKSVAQSLATITKSDIYSIDPLEEYTSEDLNWLDKKSRSSVEMNDLTSRPQIKDNDLELSKYETIFIGFPIWWYAAPRIINTFLEKYDLNDKKVILFATSGGSSINGCIDKLKSTYKNIKIIAGKLLTPGKESNEISTWLKTLDLKD